MGNLQATHFWDCNGFGCDATTLQPWNERNYKAAPQYAPMDPQKYGGAKYGEKLWMTGAASDSLAHMMGPDSDCCGRDNEGGGGCGKCLLVQNHASDHPDWKAVIMKKNRCPPWSHGCDKPHFDLAVPGFDHLDYSTANVCGDHGKKGDTYINKHQSGICGMSNPKNCNCWGLPGDTPAQKRLREGCHLFKSWGWHSGTPQLQFKPVTCPDGFIKQVRRGAAFGAGGVMGFYENSSISSSVLDVAPTETMAYSFLCASLMLLIGGGIFAGLRRRSAAGVQVLLDHKMTDSEDMMQ